MIETIADAFLDALIDCAKLVPFLLLTIFLMEYLEHRTADRFVAAIRKAGRFGPLAGGAIGLVPQCGFSAACAQLYNGGLVSAGTLVAVFLSTSDEAIPILLTRPEGLPALWRLILIKIAVAVAAGFLLDALWTLPRQQADYIAVEEPHRCASDGQLKNIILAAVKRTLSILLFLFLVTLGLNLLIAFIGEERLSALLLPGVFQPVIAALIGFIPNCAASVLITQLYLDGMISFGSAAAGLCTASGIGLIVLLRGKRGVKACAIILGTVFLFAVLTGTVLQLLM